jgi:hypothetical protein
MRYNVVIPLVGRMAIGLEAESEIEAYDKALCLARSNLRSVSDNSIIIDKDKIQITELEMDNW